MFHAITLCTGFIAAYAYQQQQQHVPAGQSYDPYASYYGHLAPVCPPPELRPIVDKTAEYVAKNSDDFEHTVLERHIGDPRFGFLNPWDEYHAYYQAMKQYNRAVIAQGGVAFPPVEALPGDGEEIKLNIQKLSSSGTVSFRLQSKNAPSTAGPLPAPCSGFKAEGYLEEVPEEYVEAAEGYDEQGQSPPTKRQRLENGGGVEDDIGNSVQVHN